MFAVKYVLLFAVVTVFATTVNAAAEWQRLTTEKKTTCTRVKPCRFEERSGKAFYVHFVGKEEPSRNLFSIEQVVIKNNETGKAQTFAVPEAARFNLNEPAKIYSVDFKNNGGEFLALYSFLSKNDGNLYYYFTYDPKIEKFQISKETAPKLEYDPAKKAYIGVNNTSYIYREGKDSGLFLDEAAMKKEEKAAADRKKTNR